MSQIIAPATPKSNQSRNIHTLAVPRSCPLNQVF